MGSNPTLSARGLFLHYRAWPLLAWGAVVLLLGPACMVAGDAAPARPLFTATPAPGLDRTVATPAQAVLVVTATPIPVETRPPVVIATPTTAVGPTTAPNATAARPETPTTAVAPPTRPQAGPQYTIQPGDSLSSLSRRFGVPVAELARVNGLATDAGLRAGASLSLPAGTWSDRLAIRALQPESGSRVRSPIVVRGTAATFEGLVVVEALDASGARLAQVSAKAASPDAGQHGPFEATLAIPSAPSDRAVTIRLYWPSPRDGSPSDEIRIPVTVAG